MQALQLVLVLFGALFFAMVLLQGFPTTVKVFALWLYRFARSMEVFQQRIAKWISTQWIRELEKGD